MKRFLALILSVLMIATLVAGCGGNSASTPPPASEAATGSDAPTATPKRIAMISDPVGTNPFLTQVENKLAEMKAAGTYAFDYSVIECADTAAWAENIRASVEEGYDLIIAVGWQAADPLKEVANMFPDKAQYVCIDTVVDSPYVKSYTFKAQEAAFLIGAIAASVSADAGKPDGPFGGVHANPGAGSWEWRYGYMAGARAINPDLKLENFLFNYTKSYTDAPVAKELALQQAAQGCVFINAASAVADNGTFEAAKEKGFYTSGQDADQTTADNPYILTTQVKYTGVVTEYAVKEFFEGGIQPGSVALGLKDGVVGAVYITDDGTNPRNKEVLTDEIVAKVRDLADKIKSGEIDLSTLPLEEEYVF